MAASPGERVNARRDSRPSVCALQPACADPVHTAALLARGSQATLLGLDTQYSISSFTTIAYVTYSRGDLCTLLVFPMCAPVAVDLLLPRYIVWRKFLLPSSSSLLRQVRQVGCFDGVDSSILTCGIISSSMTAILLESQR